MRLAIFLLLTAILLPVAAGLADDTDPYLWLEEVEGEKALEWVKERSATDTAELEAVPVYGEIHERLLEILTSSDRIPFPSVRGEWIYNFWQDKDHVRGIWRRPDRNSGLGNRHRRGRPGRSRR